MKITTYPFESYTIEASDLIHVKEQGLLLVIKFKSEEKEVFWYLDNLAFECLWRKLKRLRYSRAAKSSAKERWKSRRNKQK